MRERCLGNAHERKLSQHQGRRWTPSVCLHTCVLLRIGHEPKTRSLTAVLCPANLYIRLAASLWPQMQVCMWRLSLQTRRLTGLPWALTLLMMRRQKVCPCRPAHAGHHRPRSIVSCFPVTQACPLLALCGSWSHGRRAHSTGCCCYSQTELLLQPQPSVHAGRTDLKAALVLILRIPLSGHAGMASSALAWYHACLLDFLRLSVPCAMSFFDACRSTGLLPPIPEGLGVLPMYTRVRACGHADSTP
jgi:hypothetical protein